ncbi:SDR family NAD(P)-dependent oxidoreductase [Actinomadura napierensis]|uniref:SDR family oxidoreductase n=1 Tax=Actinomadura napierensis TaxID=267854 RepID=A0ABP5M5C2_9ACTN
MTVSGERLAGKVAVITGAGSGIGRSIAVLFAEHGAKVVCADRSGEQDGTAAHIGEAAVAVHADVAVAADVQAMIETAERRFGRLDILCNNAGFGGPRKPITEQDESTFDNVIAVNLKGVFLGMKYGIAAMLRTGGGSVVNTASSAGLVGWKAHSVYAAAKGGVVQMTKSAALDYAEQGVRVNAICPGMTWTGLAGASEQNPSPPPDMPMRIQPMNRWGLASELAAAALFLASDEASFVTGTALPVDGGYVAR